MAIYTPDLADSTTEKRTLQYLLITSGETENPLKQMIIETMRESGIECLNTEELPKESVVRRTVQRAIEQADFVIADLTHDNQNVMYELGYADALRKPILPVIEAGDTIPSDLAGHQFLIYDPRNPQQLRKYLSTWATNSLNAPLRKSVYE
jgi:nucleoside 2-deoxyribosyltransferase